MVFRTDDKSPEPKKEDITTPAPTKIPWKSPTKRNVKGPQEVMAASASLPTKFPTTRESVVLYSCWNKFPMKIGKAKERIFLCIDPIVINLVFRFIVSCTVSQLERTMQE